MPGNVERLEFNADEAITVALLFTWIILATLAGKYAVLAEQVIGLVAMLCCSWSDMS